MIQIKVLVYFNFKKRYITETRLINRSIDVSLYGSEGITIILSQEG